jgi:hypothetical protein
MQDTIGLYPSLNMSRQSIRQHIVTPES